MGQRLSRASAGAFSCVLALAIDSSAAVAQTTGKATPSHSRKDAAQDMVVTEAHIFLFKYALALRPDQMSYWTPVESALRDLAQRPATNASIDGSNGRWKRLVAAAGPLIKTFDAGQKRSLHMLARTFGFEHWLAAN